MDIAILTNNLYFSINQWCIPSCAVSHKVPASQLSRIIPTRINFNVQCNIP